MFALRSLTCWFIGYCPGSDNGHRGTVRILTIYTFYTLINELFY